MRKLPSQVFIVAVWLGGAFHAVASEVEPTMTIYSDVTGAQELMAKDYPGAIQKMLEVRRENPLFLFNNLCVAYTLSGQLSEAHDACTKALEQVDQWRNYGDDWFERKASTRIRKQHRARALSHLEVLKTLEAPQVASNARKPQPATTVD